MPQFSAGGAGELIRAILALENAIGRLADPKQKLDIAIELSDRLKVAATPGTKVKVLEDVVRSGAAGPATSDVYKSLRAYRSHSSAYDSIRRSRDRLQQRIDDMRRRHAGLPGGPVGSGNYLAAQNLRLKILAAEKQRYVLGAKASRERRRAARALSGGASEAEMGLAAGGRAGSLALVVGRLNVALVAATAAYKVGAAAIHAAADNIHRYGGYSYGGVQARMIEQYGDLMRNMYISSKTSDSMKEFAEAHSRMKDAFAPLQATIADLTNKLGTWAANQVANAAKAALGPQVPHDFIEKNHPQLDKDISAAMKERIKADQEVTTWALERVRAEKELDDARVAGDKKRIAEMERETERIKKEQAAARARTEGIRKKEDALRKQANDLMAGEQKRLDDEADVSRHRDKLMRAFASQFQDLPKFGKDLLEHDDPRARKMRDAYRDSMLKMALGGPPNEMGRGGGRMGGAGGGRGGGGAGGGANPHMAEANRLKEERHGLFLELERMKRERDRLASEEKGFLGKPGGEPEEHKEARWALEKKIIDYEDKMKAISDRIEKEAAAGGLQPGAARKWAMEPMRPRRPRRRGG